MSSEKISLNHADALFQIAEPQSSRSQARRSGYGIGIDLGTTHSLVAMAPQGEAPRVLTDAQGKALLPSIVSYIDHQISVGEPAKAQQIQHPSHVISSVKRFMGRGTQDIRFRHPYTLSTAEASEQKLIRFELGEENPVTPIEVSAEILRVLRLRAEAELGGPVDGAVITVPAYFDDAQRQATKDAGRIAGLNVYRLLAEPTAAALAYGLDQAAQGFYAVYDLGGGTFDISILRLHEGVFQVLATGGNSALGGDDFDRALVEHFIHLAQLHSPRPQQLEALRLEARRVKEVLSKEEQAFANVADCGLENVKITREQLNQLIQNLVQQTIVACRRTLKDAGVQAEDLDGVILVGGSTRVPLVQSMVERAFGQKPRSDVDPDCVVAYGAAIQADVLSGSPREGVTLLDVIPLSLGIETMGGIVEKLIPRNSTIPIAANQVFTNYSEKQTGMKIHVVQGERELAADNRSLAQFELKGIPRLPPSMARVEVSFQLDADALLTVTARELMTGVKQSVEVKATYGLSEEEVDRLVIESLNHAEEDFRARDVAEARVELGRVCLAVTTAIAEVGHLPGLLPETENTQIQALLERADQLSESQTNNPQALIRVRKDLESAAEPFARRRMERALRAGMTGKSLHEIESALAETEAELEERRGGHFNHS